MAYHMRRQDREIKDRDAIESAIGSGKYAVCGLCTGDEPYIVTLSYGYDKSRNRLYFHCANEGLKLDILRKNPRVCLTIIDDRGYIEHECSHSYMTVVIRGNMEIITEADEKLEAVKVLIDHFEKDPSHMMARVDSESEEWKRTVMLRLFIEEMTGKERRRKPTSPA